MVHSASPQHGASASRADPCRTALVVTDMLNRYEHDDADQLIPSAAAVLSPIAALRDRAQAEGVVLVYVNDNHGDWAAGRHELCDRAPAGPHARLVAPVLPPEDAALTMMETNMRAEITTADECRLI